MNDVNEHIGLFKNIDLDKIKKISNVIVKAYKNENKLIIFGNGGSAADAQHMAGELVNRFKINRKPLPAIALTTDSSVITSIANDFSFNEIFEKQIEALGKKGDIVIGISTSGNSKNVITAIKKANELGCKTICLTGNNGGELNKYSEINFIVPSKNTPRIQEVHTFVIHKICEEVEKMLFR